MRAIIEGNETRIRKLRVTSNERDVLALRLHLDRILGSADLRPSGLPSGAVMCIRNLRVSTRLPLELRDSRFADEWKASIAASLDQLVMRASRPAFEAVPLDARAVVFRDRAELLACLASDWCRGLVLARWWWQGLFRNQSASRVVKDSWRAAPEYVPAALAQLVKRNAAHQFINEWSNNESIDLLQNVLTTFALQELLPVIELARHADNGQPAFENASNPPWPSWASSESGLGGGQQLLLSIGLLIQRAPAVVRTRDFARAVRDWHERISSHSGKPTAENDDEDTIREPELNSAFFADRDIRVDSLDFESAVVAPQRQLSRTVEFLTQEPTSAPSSLRKTRPDVSAGTQQRESPPVAQSDVAAKGDVTARTEEVSELSPMQVNESGPACRLGLESEPSSEQGSLSPESELAFSDIAGQEMLETQQQFDTRLGGLFYLVNVGLYLNLYSDFTTPQNAGIELNIWDFIALVGKELVGGDDDPIWPFLAQLAGREADDTPGEGFMPEADWRVAPEWLADLSTERPWRWNASEVRLRLAHPEGFLVVDLELDSADSARQLQTEIEKYEAVLGHSIKLQPATELAGLETLAQQLAPQLREWLSRLMPYVRARLRVALGLAEDAAAGAIFCRRQATVRATDTHVDVFFSLADLPLEIRFAGLDRDPGWVPAAGRFIAFHFD